MSFPEPYRARPARPDDLDSLVELFEARDAVDVGFVDPVRDEILGDWALPRFEFERDTVIAEAPDGSVAAYGVVLVNDPSVQILTLGKVHPDHSGLGLGNALVAEAERRAAALLSPGVAAPLRSIVPATAQPAVDMVLAQGYRHVRSAWIMQRGLPADDVQASLPRGFTLRLGTVEDQPVAHQVLDEAFREHFGYEPWTFDEWRSGYQG
ncbi:MAG: hypothetical protein OEW66_09550, partial [Actinomycetota bacterium]|nr:hypothetical protein [Actinomycetota bacterium]